ncbi:alpha-amylase family glycosyl hydrolase [Mycobacterium uberis]|uniref:alpha-amylase family glycosyl hydrolase n=1 Tax=Mycobacterium uberis TaxID=2162698 RepID=UPI001FB45263|nr:alpha-amylase family glycosyl hydrolase [Mycobacterium uberis]
MTAVHRSCHEYYITDPTTVSTELGSPNGLVRLSAATQTRGIGLVVDIVPDHVEIDKNRQHP